MGHGKYQHFFFGHTAHVFILCMQMPLAIDRFYTGGRLAKLTSGRGVQYVYFLEINLNIFCDLFSRLSTSSQVRYFLTQEIFPKSETVMLPNFYHVMLPVLYHCLYVQTKWYGIALSGVFDITFVLPAHYQNQKLESVLYR